uniref:Uncharacterized protein n=1 Tax=Pyxicephalus adspersus TaxID=30357 RepID=A0AAV2ZU94_PYXAD|nr:TPA: hypothetical protein GDO54_013093 [Pyxicephalus adspersus]
MQQAAIACLPSIEWLSDINVHKYRMNSVRLGNSKSKLSAYAKPGSNTQNPQFNMGTIPYSLTMGCLLKLSTEHPSACLWSIINAK